MTPIDTRYDPRSGSSIPMAGSRGNSSQMTNGMSSMGDSALDIDVTSLRRARKYQIIAILMFFVSILCAVGYYMFYKNTVSGKQAACWNHEMEVESLAKNYLSVNGFSSYPAYVEDIPTFSEYETQCPNGGKYTWNPVTGEYSCSVHGEHPDSWNKPTSEVTGKTITNTNNNTSNKK